MNIPIKALKKDLSYWAEEASKGSQILVTKYNRPYIVLSPGKMAGLYHGSKVGQENLTATLHQASKGKYLAYLLQDREESDE